MFCITVKFKNEPTVWTLMYKTEEASKTAWGTTRLSDNATHFSVDDDFGQRFVIDAASVAGMSFEDLDKSMLAHIERGLHNARTQAKAQQIAMNDPVLKTAAMTRGQGPGIFDPQANGRMQG